MSTQISYKSAQLATGTSTTVTTAAGDMVVVGSVDHDATLQMPAQQSTVSYFNADNPNWTRNVRASNVAVSIVRNGSTTVAWTTDLLVRAALLVTSDLTWETYFSRGPADATTGYHGTLTSNVTPALPADGDHIHIDAIVYTFKDALTDPGGAGKVPGEVLIDAAASSTAGKVAKTLANLAACIEGGDGAGTLYTATAVSPNASVSVLSLAATTLTVRAIGTVTNIATTLTVTGAWVAWGSATLVAPYPVSFVASASSELTPLVFTWYEADTVETSYSALESGGIYLITPDGSGLGSTLTITPTDRAKAGYHYKCVVTDSLTSTLLSTGELPADGDTVIIGGITYTFKDTLGADAGNVHIESTVAGTLSNLAACISAGAGHTTAYYRTAVYPNASVLVDVATDVSVRVSARPGVTGATLSAASVGTVQLSWSSSEIPNVVTSDSAVLTIT